jgi:uncharacterized protein HemY
MPKRPAHKKPPPDAFIKAARAAEADEDEKRWEARLKAVAKPAKKRTIRSPKSNPE